MKVAILFDFLEGRGGGEKLTYFLAKKYNADIFSGYANWDKILPEFKNFNVNTFNGVPKTPLMKQEYLIKKFKELYLGDYKTIIALGYYSFYASIKNHPVIWYTYGLSPIFYKKADKSPVKEGLFWKIGSYIWKKKIEKKDRKTVRENVDKIVTISNYAKGIIDSYYSVNSLVINPPVDTEKFYNKPCKDYYLLVARFEPGKRVELAIEAFKKMPDKNLYIEGSGSREKYLKSLIGNSENIKLLGRVSSEELLELYSNCIALIGTAFYDEWSMPMVEALASGKPCVAVNQGSYPEIIDNMTGVLVEASPESIIKGVNKITSEVSEGMKNNCIEKSKYFDINSFYDKWDYVIRGVSNE